MSEQTVSSGATSIASPFGPSLEPHIEALPPAFREQFLLSPEAPYQIVLEGQMHRIWHRPRWLGPLFWTLGKFNILVSETGENISTRVVIAAGRDTHGQPYQTWKRMFRFQKPRYFNTRVVYDPHVQRAAECVGPAGVLRMVDDVQFHPPAMLEMNVYAWVLQLGRWRLQMPRGLGRWLFMVVHTLQRADDSHGDTFHVDLKVSHPLLGPVFGYEGTFQIKRHNPLDEARHADHASAARE